MSTIGQLTELTELETTDLVEVERPGGAEGNHATLTTLRDLINPDISAKVYRSTAQSLDHNTTAPIAFDSEHYDTNDFHDTVSNLNRLTIPADGKYQMAGRARFAVNATGSRQLSIRLNGLTVIAYDSVEAAGAATMIGVDVEHEFVAGDYVELLAFQNSGGSLDVEATDYSPLFWIRKVA